MNGRGELIRCCVRDVVAESLKRTGTLTPSEQTEALWEAGEALRRHAKNIAERRNPSGHFKRVGQILERAQTREGA